MANYHHGDLKRALIDAGEQLLIEHGAAGLSLRETAKLVGVSHTAPYRHFKDKDALLTAITESGFDSLAETLQNVTKEHIKDPKQQLIGATVAYVKLAITHIEMHQLMFGRMLDEDEMSEGMLEKKQLVFKTLLQIIKNGQKKKVFKKEEPQTLATAAWSMMHGYTMLISTGQLKETATTLMQIESLAREVVTYLLDGLTLEATTV
jgi:AcrR family transcriptional regulator